MGRRLVVLLLLLVLVGSALPAVQAQGISMYILVYGGGGNIAEDFGKTGSFRLNRVSLGAGYGHEAHIRLCFSGSATPGEDYYVSAGHRPKISLSGGCFTESFDKGHGNFHFYINTKHDGNGSPETINVRLDRLGNSYYVIQDTVRFRIVNG